MLFHSKPPSILTKYAIKTNIVIISLITTRLNYSNSVLVPKNKPTKTLLGVSFVAVFAVLAFTPLPSAITNIVSATVVTGGATLDATINTASKINKGGQDGVFGYGILTTTPFGGIGDSLMVATTHKGVLDSEKQGGDQFSPVWHNHYVQLKPAGAYCAAKVVQGVPALEIDKLSFESPGKVKVHHQNILDLEDMPSVLDGTDALSSDPTIFSPKTVARLAVEFTLNPVNDAGETTLEFTHVCVENIIATGLS